MTEKEKIETVAKAIADSQLCGGWNEIVTEGLRDMFRLQAGVALAAVRGVDQTEQLSALKEFLRWSMASGPWGGNDLDGADVQNKAEKLGLIVKVPYDPAKHGEAICDIQPGEDWFVMAAGII